MALQYRRCRQCNDIQETNATEYLCEPCTVDAWVSSLSFWKRVRLAFRIVRKGGENGR